MLSSLFDRTVATGLTGVAATITLDRLDAWLGVAAKLGAAVTGLASAVYVIVKIAYAIQSRGKTLRGD